MKTFACSILFFCITMLFASINESETDKKFLENCLKPTVLIESDNTLASGTGFIIKSIKNKDLDLFVNIIFSCDHILKSKMVIIKVSSFDNAGIFEKYNKFQGMVLATDGENDLSTLLFLSIEPMPTVVLNPAYKPKIRDNLFAIGHGLGETSRYAEGKFTGVIKSEISNKITTYRTSVPIVFGDSGGPLFFEDKVVGIANSMRSAEYGQNKFPVYDISFYKPLSCMENMVKTTSLMNDDFSEVRIPEINMYLLWSQLLEIKN